MQAKLDIVTGDINNVIFKLSWPMIVAFLLQTSFNIVDGIFVGRLSAEALAAVSISFPIILLMISLASGLGIGTTSIIARSIGAKNYKKANNVAEHSILLAVLSALFFTVGGLLFGKYLFGLIGADNSLLTLVLEYTNILFLGSIFMFLAFIANNILRGEGNMKIPMFIMGGSAVLNTILDPLFIFTLGLGVRGAALATVLSRTIGCIIVFAYILKGKSIIKLNFKYFKYNFSILKEIIYIGIPSSISQIMVSIAFFLLTGIVSNFGALAIASFGIIFRLEGLILMPLMGLMTAIITIIGQNLGAKKIKRAYKTTINASVIAVTFSLIMGLIFFFFSKPLALLFNNNPEVVRYTTSFFNINFWTYSFIAITFMITGSFLGAGKAITTLMINIMRLLIIMVPLAYLLSIYYGLIGVWIAIGISSVTSGIISIIWFKISDFK